MANITINMPVQTGDTAHDFNELYSWANRLVTELRTLIYALDSSNIRSLDASRLTGRVDASMLAGTADALNAAGENGITLTDTATGAAARIYMNGTRLNIEADSVYLNGSPIETG